MNTKTKPKSTNKYCISEKIVQWAQKEGIAVSRVKWTLATCLEVSYRHFNKMIQYRVGERGAINADQLLIIAKYLDCKVDDLYHQ